MNTSTRILQYLNRWSLQGYPDDIPDEVPDSLMRLALAPSYKAIAMCILRNDLNLLALGFFGTHSNWYDALKKIELDARAGGSGRTRDLFAEAA